MINIESLKHKGLIKIVGHPNADFDCMVSGYLLKYIFTQLGIVSKFVLQDMNVDELFESIAHEIKFDYELCFNLKEEDTLFLVDHTANYKQRVVGCFDHHPELAKIDMNYINKPKTSCAKLIYDWAQEIGIVIPKELTILTVYACYVDSLSFKSTKAVQEDKIWCLEKIKEYNMDEKEVERKGYGLTPRIHGYMNFLKAGLKTYNLQDKQIKSSYAIVDNDEDVLELIRYVFAEELNDTVIAWCFILGNIVNDYNRILLVTKDFSLIQTTKKLYSRGLDIIPAVMDFLSFKNDGTITKYLIDNDISISTMESCTSGLVASNITDYEGASAILKGSSITYSNEAKINAGVSKYIIEDFGVYSLETAIDMAWNTRRNFGSQIGIGVTGSLGNVDPANKDSVSGKVFFQICQDSENCPVELLFQNLPATRKEQKQKVVDIVLSVLYAILKFKK